MDSSYERMAYDKKKKKLYKEVLSKIKKQDKDECLIYLIPKDDIEGGEDDSEDNVEEEEDLKIRLFGDEFVKNNKNNCKIIINGKEEDLTEFYLSKKNEEIIKIKILCQKKLSDMSHMFNGCITLINLPNNMSEWDLSNVTNINYMFSGCQELLSFPDISKWNTSKITTMVGLFSNCQKIERLPDISKWDTSKVVDLNNMLSGCINLSSLPDISKWNTSNFTDISYFLMNVNY